MTRNCTSAGRKPILRGNRSGAAYVLALTTLVVGVTFALTMLQSSGSYFLTERSRNRKQMAMDMAEAGIDYAYIQVNNRGQSVPCAWPAVNLASGRFVVTATDIPGTATMLLTSTGTVNGVSYTIKRVTKGARMDKIMDNLDPEYSSAPSWSTGTMANDKYAANYRWHSTQDRWEPACWTLTLPIAGNYDVYAWWPQGTNRSTAAPYIIPTSAGQVIVTVDQQQNGGKWNLLGRFHFNAGSNTIVLSYWAPAGFVVCADAVRVTGPYGN